MEAGSGVFAGEDREEAMLAHRHHELPAGKSLVEFLYDGLRCQGAVEGEKMLEVEGSIERSGCGDEGCRMAVDGLMSMREEWVENEKLILALADAVHVDPAAP
jgi:hypothetical protein